jgi:putative acetyltransferase
MSSASSPDSSSEVVIRPTRVEDAEGAHQLRLLPSSVEFTLAIPSLRLEQSRQFIESLGPDDHTFVAVLDGQIVGLAGLHVGQGRRRLTASLGMSVHDQFQGRGIGRKLLAALLDVADNHLGLVRVELEVFPDNVRAIRLYESVGFEHEGCKRKSVIRNGRHQDGLMMARLRQPHWT